MNSSDKDASLPGDMFDSSEGFPVSPRGRRPVRRASSDSDHVRMAAKIAMENLGVLSDDEGISSSPGGAKLTRTRRAALYQRMQGKQNVRIYDDPALTQSYNNVPLLEQDILPRGGISVATKAIGRIQFGIPPETIKDSMRLGIEVPRVYIVPVDRFCREPGPALGINLAEFEFPAYFNYFVRRKKCILVVDSEEAEQNILKVFEETLMGPAEFRDKTRIKENNPDDFDPSYPQQARPNFYKEFAHWRIAEKTDQYDELTTAMLLEFCHFDVTDSSHAGKNKNIGIPPELEEEEGAVTSNNIANFEEGDDYSIGSFADDGAPKVTQHKLHKSYGDMAWTTSPTKDPSGLNLTALSLHRSVTSIDHHGNVEITHRSLGSVEMSFSASGVQRPTIEDWIEQPKANEESPRRDSLGSEEEHSKYSDASLGSSNLLEEGDDQAKHWLYSKVKWMGDLATLWPPDATPQEIEERSVPRVEIFKMSGGTEYIVHDVDEKNNIVGKARVSGTVKVPDELEVEGFLDADVVSSAARATSGETSVQAMSQSMSTRLFRPPTFHPPSFGVTILGNSHGFDKNGSTSGYVIWINGRGVMVDPPPFSSATLEREGIRPQMIIAIILTHCHADHDAGAFQKILTGSQVAIITAPSIYNSFIRKYAALSGLSAKYLRTSHRYRPAIVGQPLEFQGATFHFNFSLHTIPCITFKVVWRGRSIVYSGDHCGIPSLIGELESKGTLTKERADILRNIALQDCDVLLHEAGVPPIHTPIAELQKLPEKVKERLYIVHTSALPPDCGLRVAPVGTAGTLRLDDRMPDVVLPSASDRENTVRFSPSAESDRGSVGGINPDVKELVAAGYSAERAPPRVYYRPACVSDAWFILNLLSNVPFFNSISFTNTMDVLEIVRVEIFCAGEVVVPAQKRKEVLSVVWEGTCVEKVDSTTGRKGEAATVWHAGDWMGPVSLQPNVEHADKSRDVIAASPEGVKVITIRITDLEKILRPGSDLYRKYLSRQNELWSTSNFGESLHSVSSLELLDVLKFNSVFGRLSPLQQRSLEAIAEGPRKFKGGTEMWQLGSSCDYAFLIVAGTATFDTKSTRRPAKEKRKWLSKSMSIGQIVDIGDGRILEADKVLQNVTSDSEYARLRNVLADRAQKIDDKERRYHDGEEQRYSQVDRFANQVLARLYSSKKVFPDLIFGRGCFLSDTSRMVSGELVRQAGDLCSLEPDLHTSAMIATPGEGCVAFVFPRTTLIAFLNSNPGVLLSVLGTQVVV